MAIDYSDLEVDSIKLSKINSAVIVNINLNNLFVDFTRHYRTGKYLSANSDLDCIWIILGGDIGIKKDKTDDKTEDSYNVIEKELSESGTLQDSVQVKGFDPIDDKQLDKLKGQKVVLLKKAMFLRKLQNKQGKGTAYQDEKEGDFD